MKKFLPFIFLFLLAYSAPAQYNSLLWQISGNGLKAPSYLFGTMHTKDARAFTHVTAAMKQFGPANAYAMELDPSGLMDMGILSKVMMGKGYSLKAMIPEQEYKFLDSVTTTAMGFPVALFDKVEPVFIMTLLESLEMGLSDSSIDGNTEVMDVYLYNQAKKAKKKIIGIETVEEQLDALHVLSYDEQAELLVEAIHSIQQHKGNEAKDVLRLYLAQQLDSILAMDTSMPAVLHKALVSDRNTRMANRVAVFIEQQPTFIAIGALHLPGNDGVIAQLRKKGFTVSVVKN